MLALLLGAAVFAALAAGALAPLEVWFPRSQARPAVGAIALCAGLLLLDTACMRLIGNPVLTAAASIADRAGELALAPWARIALALVIGDVIGYGLHRAMHRVPWLWRLHRIHHARVELHFWEAWRLHPIEFVAHSLAVGIPGALLGAPLADYVGLVLLRKAFTAYLHANVSWGHGPVSWLLASPAWHAAHHDADERGASANFASLFPFIDRFFGTDVGTPRIRWSGADAGTPRVATVSAATAVVPAEADAHTGAVAFGSE